MGHLLAEITEGERFVLHISNEGHSLDLYGIIKKHLKENIALITILHEQRLAFENVHVDAEAMGEENINEPGAAENIKSFFDKKKKKK